MAEDSKLSPRHSQRDYQTVQGPQNQDPEIPAKKKKEPRRVVYCSDGVYEEYSTDEEEIEEQKRAEEQRKQRALIDPKGLSWMPWMIHYSWLAGSRVFNYADSWGERLAWFFGITSPKYYREIQEFKKMQIEEAERKKEEAENTSGWTNIGNSPSEVITELDASKLTASNPSKAIYQIETPTTTCDTTDETNLESRP